MATQITLILGNSSTGKTTLAKKKIAGNSVHLDLLSFNFQKFLTNNPFVDLRALSKNSNIVSHKLAYIIPNIAKGNAIDVRTVKDDLIGESTTSIFIKVNNNGNEEWVPLESLGVKAQMFLLIIVLIRSKQKFIVDNYDALFIGSGFSKITQAIITELKFNNTECVFTMSNLPVFQLFALHIPKNIDKAFFGTYYDWKENKFDVLEMTYAHVLHTLSKIYNGKLGEELESLKDYEYHPSMEADY